MNPLLDRARLIRLAAFDVDGVLSDGRLYYAEAGDALKAFGTLDGHGLKMLAATGVHLAVITARSSRLVEQRARNLGVEFLFQGVDDKASVLEKLLGEMGLEGREAAYMGDDVVDLPVMRRCGLAITVPDAPALVRRHAHFVTRAKGGRGAVREACELIMWAQGTLDGALAPYLR